jgi:flagellin-like protein
MVKKLFNNNEAISELWGTVVLVVITIALACVIAFFVFSLSPKDGYNADMKYYALLHESSPQQAAIDFLHLNGITWDTISFSEPAIDARGSERFFKITYTSGSTTHTVDIGMISYYRITYCMKDGNVDLLDPRRYT